MALRRRSFAALLVVASAGCSAVSSDLPTRSASASESGSPTTSHVCSHAVVEDVTIRSESYTDGTATLYEDHVVVRVDVRGPRPPPLELRIDAAGGRERYSREVDGTLDREGFRFGPFSHNGVSDVTTWFAGCSDSSTATTTDS